MENDIYMLWLSTLVHKIGSRKLNFLLNSFGTAKDIYNAPTEALQEAMPQAHFAFNTITTNRSLEVIEKCLQAMEGLGIRYLARNHTNFPRLLKEIPDPPVGIFYIGTLPTDQEATVAIIGSRKCSEYGLLTARLLAKPLAEAGVVVVSGMARGVDSMAHRGALQGGGQTIAVLGCGVDICYPKENKDLRGEIINSGCVLSEYAPGVRPTPAFFPARNRIISGLSRGIVVTEASLKSGTLITVDQAQDQGREVLAVPGNISSRLSQGTNQLIRDGAFPVASHEDILSILKIKPKGENAQKEKTTKVTLAPEEKQVYDRLSLAPISFDTLAEVTEINIGMLHLVCTQLELKGLAKKLPGARYIKN